MNKQTIYIIVGVILVAVVAWVVATRDRAQTPNLNSEQTINQESEQKQMAQDSMQECERTYQEGDLNNVVVNPEDKFVTLSVAGFGDIKIEVNKQDAPKTSENFIKLAKAGFYNCLTFHRVAAGFVIQGGDPEGTGAGGPGYTVPAEIGLPHNKGAIAMARTSDVVNPERASSGSQFYIALDQLEMLDGQYTVFGQVVAGMDVVEKIGAVKIDSPLGDGKPLEPVIIKEAVVSAE
ncbi:MAG: peptidylprolyl isomerase [Candidatus Doudnabacteria bacterium]